MYPQWITNLFYKNTCTDCRKEVTLDDIAAIGIRRPADFEAHLREPMAFILVACPHCGQNINFITRCPTDLLVEALEELAAQIRATAPENPPLFGPGSKASTATTQPPDGADTNAKDERVRPSIRPGQKMDRPTEAEIKAFLSRLKGMSFKTGSKGFKRLTGGDQSNNSDDNHNPE